jgi:S1-C subfamily serine protease
MPIGFAQDAEGKCPPNTDAVQSLFGGFCVLTMELSATTAMVYPGSSGSPIVNASGEVIGVINSTDATNRGNFIPLQYLKEMLDDE